MIDALKYLLLIMSLAAFPVQAQNPFIARMEQAQVNEQEIPETIRKLRDKEKIEIRENLAVGPFHFRKKPIETEKQPFCVTCHLSRPHLENTRSRSFLNMHTRYVSCETCHLEPDEREVSYRWLAYDYPAAGELIDASMSVHTQVDRESTSIQVRPGAHIAPFLDDQPLLIFSDDPYALALADEWEQASLEQKARIKL
jgi:DNA-directed RNA polymerase subunit M/transcription elongation factor TFIIS